MPNFNSEKNNRRSIRLDGYDYSSAGYYFVTICTKNQEHILGIIENEKMILNKNGEIIKEQLLKAPDHFNNTEIYTYIIMPNHIHLIIEILNGDDIDGVDVGARFITPPRNNKTAPPDINKFIPTQKTTPNKKNIDNDHQTLGKIIRYFKAKATREIRLKTDSSFAWQRNYYERIIRNDRELSNFREYIINNPKKWKNDEYYED